MLQHIKRKVLDEGALQPVIGLLSSKCHESQREAALLLGQFATAEPDYKAKIVQRGAAPPLIEMLRADDVQLKEMAAFALGRLAQNSDNQAGIVQVSTVYTDILDLSLLAYMSFLNTPLTCHLPIMSMAMWCIAIEVICNQSSLDRNQEVDYT